MPIDQPIRVRGISVPAQPGSYKVLLRGQTRQDFRQLLPEQLNLVLGDETFFRAWSQDGTWGRDAGRLSGTFVGRTRIRRVAGVDVPVGVDGELDDAIRVWREAIEPGRQIEVL
jgi:hypothetical protein